MTDLTNNSTPEESMLSSLLSSLSTPAEVIEAITAIAVGVLLTFSLNLML